MTNRQRVIREEIRVCVSHLASGLGWLSNELSTPGTRYDVANAAFHLVNAANPHVVEYLIGRLDAGLPA
jgi:hypothetical protein